MASREEEKRKRREEREAQQRAAEQGAKRKRLVMIGGAITAAIAVIAVGVVLAASGGGDEDMTVGSTGASAEGAPIPEQREKDFDAAVKASGCTFTEHPSEGGTHQNEPFDDYKTNPPTSGTHSPQSAPDGIYEPGNSPDANNWVHTLEHGRVIIQYKPGTPDEQISQLRTLTGEAVNGSPGYHMVLMENNTEMEPQVAAVTWTRSLTCDEMTDKTFDAMRVFRDRFVDKAPEFVP